MPSSRQSDKVVHLTLFWQLRSSVVPWSLLPHMGGKLAGESADLLSLSKTATLTKIKLSVDFVQLLFQLWCRTQNTSIHYFSDALVW